MKKVLIYILLSLSILNAGVLDAYYVHKAEQEYKQGDYKQAIENFQKIEKANDKLRYDLANSYYKLKRYQDAKREYQKISDKSLEFKKLHNLGNCYAKLNQIDDAIKSYESALKIKEDKDTRFNLELLKKKKKEQEKKKKQQQKKNKKKQDKKKQKKNKQKDGKKSSSQNNSGNKNMKNDKKKEKKRDNKKKNSDKKKDGKDGKKDKQKESMKQHLKRKNMAVKKVPISDMEEKKYMKMLRGRKVNSLMLPMQQKGEHSENIKPW